MLWIYFNAFLTLTTLALLILSIRGKRIDKHPICRKCNYDLTGLDQPLTQCPECGSYLTSPKSIRIGNRTRSTTRITLAATILFLTTLATSSLIYIQAANINLNKYKPTWLLTLELKHHYLSSDPANVWDQLYRRNKFFPYTPDQSNDIAAAILTFLEANHEHEYFYNGSAYTKFLENIIKTEHCTDQNFTRMEKIMLAHLTSNNQEIADYAASWIWRFGYKHYNPKYEKRLIDQYNAIPLPRRTETRRPVPYRRVSPQTELQSLTIAFDIREGKYPGAALSDHYHALLVNGPIDHGNQLQSFGQLLAKHNFTYSITLRQNIEQYTTLQIPIDSEVLAGQHSYADRQIQAVSLSLVSSIDNTIIPLTIPKDHISNDMFLNQSLYFSINPDWSKIQLNHPYHISADILARTHIDKSTRNPARKEEVSPTATLTIKSNTFNIVPANSTAVELIHDQQTKQTILNATVRARVYYSKLNEESTGPFYRNNELWLTLKDAPLNKQNIAAFDANNLPDKNQKFAHINNAIRFSPAAKLTPFCYDISLRINDKTYPIEPKIVYDGTDKLTGSLFTMYSPLPSSTTTAKTCDIILTPNPDYAKAKTRITKILADPITIPNIPIVWLHQTTDNHWQDNTDTF
ncbi:hypothetical protein JD969_09440 [Planctomycetota bacterium]|nr:hypothetical protein JD969_09440 [Planctomycetota bacterium]